MNMTISIQRMTELLADLRSGSRAVTGTRSIELVVPVVLEAVPVLDVQSTPNGATVRVYFPNMRDTDLVAIVWFGTPGVGTPDIKPVTGNAAGYVDFTVPATAVVANDGLTVNIIAALVRDDEQWMSDDTPLLVGSPRPVPLELRPFITRVWDARGNVGDSGVTFDAGLNVEGMASPGEQVEIFCDRVSAGKATADSNGSWTHWVPEVRIGAHALTVTALYGAGLRSPARAVTRAANLSIDTATLVLDGVHFHQASSPAWWRDTGNYVARVTATRKASGGSAPIRYTSANTRVATVDNNGHVISQANGSTRITATDALGKSVSYPVTCSNNYNLYESGASSSLTFQQALNWISGSSENRPIPHNTTTLGRSMLAAMSAQFVTITSCMHHTGTLNPNSQMTNIIVSNPSSAPVQAGPVGLSNKARALCYRIRKST
jgi:hypothetical protein